MSRFLQLLLLNACKAYVQSFSHGRLASSGIIAPRNTLWQRISRSSGENYMYAQRHDYEYEYMTHILLLFSCLTIFCVCVKQMINKWNKRSWSSSSDHSPFSCKCGWSWSWSGFQNSNLHVLIFLTGAHRVVPHTTSPLEAHAYTSGSLPPLILTYRWYASWCT